MKKIKNDWISCTDILPPIDINKSSSDNVMVICDGKLMIMQLCRVLMDDEYIYMWGNCNGSIYSHAKIDDEYNVTYWQPLPTLI